MDDEERRAWVELSLRGIPVPALVALLRTFGSASAVLAATRAQRAAIAAAAEPAFAAPPPAELARALDWLAVPGHDIVAWDDPRYPPALLELGHAPAVLYVIGRTELLRRPALAIVGSRRATPQGLDNARGFAGALAAAGVTIVSGLAAGIDGAAHEGALDGAGSTIAVMGTGLDRVYPAAHRALAHAIAERGLLVSEFPPGTPVRGYHFPRRNRLISGLARGVLVVEATLRSGSLITARLAGEQGREVFAVPGSIHSPLSKGCHRLIRDGAKLVETAQDVLEELGFTPNWTGVDVPHDAAPELRSAGSGPICARAVLAALGEDPVDVDTLVGRTGLSAAAVAAQLSALELAGAAGSLPGGRWQRRHG
ncbi:MAG: DNA-protecting protein DprA [Burkholderiales bacterium]|nr:DNA-protecting protein DprA [Burkholderiales bacterium]